MIIRYLNANDDDEVASPPLGSDMIADNAEILQQTEQLQRLISLYDNDPIRKNEAKTSLNKVNAIYQDFLMKEKNKQSTIDMFFKKGK